MAAEIYCFEDKAFLCRECDVTVHDHEETRKILKDHKRVPKNEIPSTFGYCEAHPDQLVNFYCDTCDIPICLNCKLFGTHASGESSTHGIIDINKVYQNAKNDAKSEDPSFKKKKTSIVQQMRTIKTKIK
jgi:hypothetical protein